MSRSNDNATTAILAFASGALLGAVAALLLAPAPGNETRRKLAGLQDDATGRIRQYAKEARFKMGPKGKNEDLQYDGGDAWI
jgi:gas vesicle protein